MHLFIKIDSNRSFSFTKKWVLKVLPLQTSGHCTGLNLLYRLTECMPMNPSLPFSEEHQQKKKTIMQTGIWITEKALNRVYVALNSQEHVTLLCYKMFGILRNKTVRQAIVYNAMLVTEAIIFLWTQWSSSYWAREEV